MKDRGGIASVFSNHNRYVALQCERAISQKHLEILFNVQYFCLSLQTIMSSLLAMFINCRCVARLSMFLNSKFKSV